MKNHFRIFVLFLSALISVHADAQQAVYTRSIYAFNSDFMLPWSGNTQLIFGERTEICKLNAVGSVLWTRSYTFGANQFGSIARFYEAITDLDSNIAIVGHTSNTILNGNAFIMRIKPNGDTLWSRKLTAANFTSFIPYDISLTNDSGYVVTGAALPVAGANQQLFVAKLTKAGNLAWLQTYASGSDDNKGHALQQLPDSGYIITGAYRLSNNLNWNMLLLRLNKNGLPQWCKQFIPLGSQASGYGFDVILNQNNFTVLAEAGNSGLMNFDFSGNLKWSKLYNEYPNHGIGHDVDMRIRKSLKKGYVLISKSVDSPYGAVNITDSLGNPEWYSTIYLTKIDALQNKDKTFSIVGNRLNFGIVGNKADINFPDVQIFKTDSMGALNSSNCYSRSTITPTVLNFTASTLTLTNSSGGLLSPIHPTLGSVSYISNFGCLEYMGGIGENTMNKISIYPNPGNGMVNISIPEIWNESIKIEIYDISGSELLCKEFFNQSEFTNIDCSGLKNGIYFVRLYKNNLSMGQAKLLISH